MFEKCLKKKEYEVLNEVFDILLNGNWLSSEDKEFCYLQVDNRGAMGYSTKYFLVKLLYHLTRVFRYFKNKEYFPLTNFQKIPNLGNTRWSTRAILVSCNPRIHSDPIYKTDVGENIQLYML